MKSLARGYLGLLALAQAYLLFNGHPIAGIIGLSISLLCLAALEVFNFQVEEKEESGIEEIKRRVSDIETTINLKKIKR